MKKSVLAVAVVAMMSCGVYAQSFKTEQDKTLYALGYLMGQNVRNFSLTAAEYKQLETGFHDSVSGKTAKVKADDYMAKIDELNRSRAAVKAKAEKAKSAAFLAKMKKEPGAVELSSGIVFVPIVEGSGDKPLVSDTVDVKYKGTLRDGTVFEDATEHADPARIPLDRVVPCWSVAVAQMKKGGKAKFGCPSDTAYGDMGVPPHIPGGGALIFEVELIDFSATPEPTAEEQAAEEQQRNGIPADAIAPGSNIMPGQEPAADPNVMPEDQSIPAESTEAK